MFFYCSCNNYTHHGDGVVSVVKGGNILYGFEDESGNVFIKPKYHGASGFSEGLANVKVDDKWGYIDEQDNVVIAPQFDRASFFLHGRAIVGRIVKKVNAITAIIAYGVIDNKGNVIIPLEYDSIGLGPLKYVQKNGKKGFLDNDGNEIIPVIYDDMGDWFYCDLIWVKKDGKYGYINKKGEIIVPLIYEYVTDIQESDDGTGVGVVWPRPGESHYVDNTGKIFDR